MKAIYREDGSKVLVEVLKDFTENDTRTVNFKVIENIKTGFCGPLIVGNEYEVSAKEDFSFYCWSLMYLDDEI